MKHILPYFIRSPTLIMTATKCNDNDNKIRKCHYSEYIYNERILKIMNSINENKPKSTPTLQVKVTPEIKEAIFERAAAADLTLSDYIRTVALSDTKVIFLDRGGSIAKSLAEININLDRALRGKDITTEVERELIAALNNVSNSLHIIFDKLNTINGI